MLANAAPPSQSGPAALLDGARADGVPSGAPAAAAAPQSGPAAPLDGARGGGAPSGAPLLRRRSSRPTPWRMAPMPAPPCRARRSPLRRRSGHLVCPLTADRAAHQPEQRAGPRRMASLRAQACRARRSPLRRRAGTRRVPRRRTERRISRGSGAHDPRFCPQLPPIPATAPHTSGCSAPRLATRRRTLLLSRSAHRAPLHLFPSAADRPPAAGRPGRWPGAVQPQSAVRSSPQNAPRPRVGCAAGATDVAPPPRCCRAARLRWPTACRWPAGTHCTWWRSWTGRAGGFAAPRAERASSLPPHQNLAGRCRRAHARRCRGLTSTNSCRFRRSHP